MNNSHEIPDLIQRDIDGRLTEEERARLAAHLAVDPAAREEHRRLGSLRDLLAALPPETPPAHLTARVLRDLRARRVAPSGWRFWPGNRVFLGYGYAAAAGAAVALLGVQILTGGRAFGPGPLDQNAVATIGSRSFLSLRTLEGSLALDVEPPTSRHVDVVLAYDPATVRLLGISNRAGGIDRIEAGDGRIQWGQDPAQRVTVLLAPRTPAGSRVEVRFSEAGGSGGSGSVEIPGRN